MKNVDFFDWKLDNTHPISQITVRYNSCTIQEIPDIHSAIHLGIVLSGAHCGVFGGQPIVLPEKQVYLTAPWEPHCTAPASGNREILLLNYAV